MDLHRFNHARFSFGVFPVRVDTNVDGMGTNISVSNKNVFNYQGSTDDHNKKTMILNNLKVLFSMTKPTITLLVVVTAIPGLLMASSEWPSIILIFSTLIGTALMSGSAAVFNQLIERSRDLMMQRTKKRALPSGRIKPLAGTVFAVILLVLGFMCLYQLATPMSAYVALSGHLFYILIYTVLLKPLTVQNIVIGGAAGAIGPIIGWSAVTNSLAWPAWVLFAIIMLWTPPHFWALAIKYKEDYAKANIPMLPVKCGIEATQRYIFYYTLTLIPAIGVLHIGSQISATTMFIAILATVIFIWKDLVLIINNTIKDAMDVFYYSCAYMFIIFGIISLDCGISLAVGCL